MGETDGVVKLVVDAEIGEVLGAHMIGPEVTELLGELALTRVLEASPDPVAVLEPSGEVVVWANDAMRRLTGTGSTSAEVRLLDVLGEETVMWGSDFPHPDGVWPDSQTFIENELGDLPEKTRNKIVCGNAADLYGFSLS